MTPLPSTLWLIGEAAMKGAHQPTEQDLEEVWAGVAQPPLSEADFKRNRDAAIELEEITEGRRIR